MSQWLARVKQNTLVLVLLKLLVSPGSMKLQLSKLRWFKEECTTGKTITVHNLLTEPHFKSSKQYFQYPGSGFCATMRCTKVLHLFRGFARPRSRPLPCLSSSQLQPMRVMLFAMRNLNREQQ